MYSEPRSDAELTAAYDAIRDARGDDSLFSRAPLTVEEAVFQVNRPSDEETCDSLDTSTLLIEIVGREAPTEE